MKPYTLSKVLALIGSIFFLAEFFFHFFGLPILEHDQIFLLTHDRYIALYALTYSFLLALSATDFKKYRFLFGATLFGILIMMLNAYSIAAQGGYHTFFPTVSLDHDLNTLGLGFLIWYVLTFLAWAFKK